MAGSAKKIGGLVVLTVACYATLANAQTPPVRVGVRLVNVAAVDRGTLLNAKELVVRLFSEVGVQLVWVGDQSALPAPNLWLTVVLAESRSVQTKPSLRDRDLGFAPMPAVRRGWLAYVLWDRIRSVARREGLQASIVLGSMVAHEVGHLLLGNDSHSPDGVMRAELGVRDFLAVLRGQSGFSPEQSERMRSRVAREPSLSVAR